MRCVIFDLDGTLVDTGRDLVAAANAVLPGAFLDPESDQAVAVRGVRAMLTLGFERHRGVADPAEIDRLYPECLAAYEASIDVHSRVYPGAVDAANALRGEGAALGIATNKPYALADLLMRRLGLREAFGPIVGADSLAVRKPDPAHLWEAVDRAGGDRGRTILVGDTATDRETARRAGVPCLLVTFGPAGHDVARLDPDGLLHHYRDLRGAVTRLLPAGV